LGCDAVTIVTTSDTIERPPAAPAATVGTDELDCTGVGGRRAGSSDGVDNEMGFRMLRVVSGERPCGDPSGDGIDGAARAEAGVLLPISSTNSEDVVRCSSGRVPQPRATLHFQQGH
jgi:hypothetical protein